MSPATPNRDGSAVRFAATYAATAIVVFLALLGEIATLQEIERMTGGES